MFKVSIKGVLVGPDGRVILLENERTKWELPGGQVEHPLDTYLFEVTPGHHVFIATYKCALVGSFDPKVSLEHKRIGFFSQDRLPDNLPAGYRASIASAMGGTNRTPRQGQWRLSIVIRCSKLETVPPS